MFGYCGGCSGVCWVIVGWVVFDVVVGWWVV